MNKILIHKNFVIVSLICYLFGHAAFGFSMIAASPAGVCSSKHRDSATCQGGYCQRRNTIPGHQMNNLRGQHEGIIGIYRNTHSHYNCTLTIGIGIGVVAVTVIVIVIEISYYSCTNTIGNGNGNGGVTWRETSHGLHTVVVAAATRFALPKQYRATHHSIQQGQSLA